MSDISEQYGIASQVTSQLHRHKRRGLGLRMTPMIDVIFLLLTFFVLTAQFDRPEQALPLVFGSDAATVVQPPPALELVIVPHADGCEVKPGDQAEAIIVSHESPAEGLTTLAERLRTTVSPDLGQAMPIRLRSDDAVSWELVTKIYDVLYGLGARDMTFLIEE